MRYIFMGTPGYAEIILRHMIDAGRPPLGVITQIDKPAGRGRKLTLPPVKLAAQEHNIPILQPSRIGNKTRQWMEDLEPEICVVAAYGKILTKKTIEVAPRGCQSHSRLSRALRSHAALGETLVALGRSGPDPQDMLALHASVDGGLSWQLVWGRIFASKRPNPRPRRIRTAFGQEAYHEGRFSAVGKYGYLLRIDMLARRDPADVGLDSLTIRTSCQCNMMSLPALLPGLNRIRVTTASAPAAGKLRVEYHWTEKPRGLRKAVKLLPARGGTFTLRAGGTAPSDIRMREVSVALV